MGFFDAIKKGAEMVNEFNERAAQKMTDEQLKKFLKKHPDNRYALQEAERRRLNID